MAFTWKQKLVINLKEEQSNQHEMQPLQCSIKYFKIKSCDHFERNLIVVNQVELYFIETNAICCRGVKSSRYGFVVSVL